MATATKKKPVKKSAKKRRTKKAVAMGNTDHHPDHKSLDGMEEERIPEIETCVSTINANKKRAKELKEENKEHNADLAEMMHEHGLTTYRCCGCVVTIKPGEETVEITKAKGSKKE